MERNRARLSECAPSLTAMSGNGCTSTSKLLDYRISRGLICYILTVAGLFRASGARPNAPKPYKALGCASNIAACTVGAETYKLRVVWGRFVPGEEHMRKPLMIAMAGALALASFVANPIPATGGC